MARLFRSLRKTLTLTNQIHIQQQQLCISPLPHIISRRTYISEMRKEAFEGHISRLLRSEIQYELQSSPSSNPPTNKFGSFLVDGRPGDRWITLKRQFADENIKVEVTMFDGAVPAPKASGGVANADDVQLHITLIVNISKGDGSVLEIMCSAWPDAIVIKRLFIRANKKMTAEPYAGPDFEELDDALQESLYDFLEARGINDDLAKYLHQYMKHKDKTELIGWMEKVKSFIERK
ncbi:uncharacterized protein At2g39795, mitochondrial [Trifolium pratense]|uniref:Uncharacterized protein n=2 Tax=Trifolium pratense TaxID=57577 RepID=A0ACB0KI97_TRIPR|nr:uncharacterized protein At2g39795, mitochondrial [Trifolium pratense]CAJ2656510.1 unnamed protein product [Trifolium pratense]